MSAATHNKRNRRGKVYLSHSEWKRRRNVRKAIRQYEEGRNRVDTTTDTSGSPVVGNTASKKDSIESNFNYYEGGESK